MFFLPLFDLLIEGVLLLQLHRHHLLLDRFHFDGVVAENERGDNRVGRTLVRRAACSRKRRNAAMQVGAEAKRVGWHHTAARIDRNPCRLVGYFGRSPENTEATRWANGRPVGRRSMRQHERYAREPPAAPTGVPGLDVQRNPCPQMRGLKAA